MGSVGIETYNNDDLNELRNKIIVKVNDVFLHKIVTVIELEDNNVSKNEGGSETDQRSHKRHMVRSKDKLE